MIAILEELHRHQEEDYKRFSAKLLPPDTALLGVRVPTIRRLAKQAIKGNWREILPQLPTTYLEEKMLRGFIIAYANVSLPEKFALIADFVPLIDNWSVCDSFCASFKWQEADKPQLWTFLQTYFETPAAYAQRFALVMSLNGLLDDAFIDKILMRAIANPSDEYYVKMAVAWLLSMAYVKYPAKVELILQNRRLPAWTHNKTIQKIRESYQVSPAAKSSLARLKIGKGQIEHIAQGVKQAERQEFAKEEDIAAAFAQWKK